MMDMGKVRLMALWLKGNWRFSCRGTWNLYTWGFPSPGGRERFSFPWKLAPARRIQRRPRQPMTPAIPGNNDLFLVISGFWWCSSSDSPHLPSSIKTRPWVSSREQLKPPHLSSWAFPCPWCCPSRHHTSSVNYPSWKWDQNHVSTVQGYLLQLCLLLL